MACVWLRHNRSQVFVNVPIIPADFGTLAQSVGARFPGTPCLALALVDTGATTTCLSRACAARAGLFPVGKIQIQGVGGPISQNSYLFHVGFPLAMPGGILAPGIPTLGIGQQQMQLHVLENLIQGCEFQAPPAFEVLLGMDVVSTGSLDVQGDGGFSFSF